MSDKKDENVEQVEEQIEDQDIQEEEDFYEDDEVQDVPPPLSRKKSFKRWILLSLAVVAVLALFAGLVALSGYMLDSCDSEEVTTTTPAVTQTPTETEPATESEPEREVRPQPSKTVPAATNNGTPAAEETESPRRMVTIDFSSCQEIDDSSPCTCPDGSEADLSRRNGRETWTCEEGEPRCDIVLRRCTKVTLAAPASN